LLNLNPDSVVASVQAQMGGGMGGNGQGLGMNGGNGGRAMESRGDVAVELLASQGRGGQGRQGVQLPEVSDADCQKVRDAFAKAPSAQTTLQGLRGRMQGGEIDQVRMREITDSVYKAAGIDGMVARACQARDRAAQGSEKETMVFLSSDGVYCAVKEEMAKIDEGAPFAPLKDLIEKFVKAGGKIYVCTPCMKKRNITEADLVEGATPAGGAALVEWLSAGSPAVAY
jgi:predicted peroxiredoxin